MGQCTGELIGTAWVIRLEGWFISDQDAALIQEAMANPPAEARCVVVNWSGILHINSTSLGAVMRGELDVTSQGRQYRNCAYSDRAARIVHIFRKKFSWNYYETEEEAVRACLPTDADDARPTMGT